MNIEDAELYTEVICVKLLELPNNRAVFPLSARLNREIGHIGKITAFFPMENAVHIGHIDYDGESYTEVLTPYLLDELEIYEPVENKLQKAIRKLKVLS